MWWNCSSRALAGSSTPSIGITGRSAYYGSLIHGDSLSVTGGMNHPLPLSSSIYG